MLSTVRIVFFSLTDVYTLFMQQSFGGSNPCRVCRRPVYHAERAEGSNEFHKMCLKCSICNKLLDSTTVAMHEGKQYQTYIDVKYGQ